MKRKIALVALAFAGVAGAYLLVLEGPPAPSPGSLLAVAGASREPAPGPSFAASASNDAVATPSQRPREAPPPTVKPELVIPGGQDTFYPTEGQKQQLAQAMSNSGASPADVRQAQKAAAFIDYNERISKVLQKPDAPLSAEDFGDLMAQTQQMTRDRYLTLPESQAVRARLLGTQYSGADLEEKLVDLNRDIQASREQLLAAGDPSRRPEMQALREQEAQIWKEANSMTSYPNGMTKEQYVVSRLKR